MTKKSKNYGDAHKTDWTLLFDDFPASMLDLSKPVYRHVMQDELLEVVRWAFEQGVTFHDILAAREYGVKKYERYNWKLSMGTGDHAAFLLKNKKSIYRHLMAYHDGEEIDEESGCKHLAMVCLRCMIKVEYDQNQP